MRLQDFKQCLVSENHQEKGTKPGNVLGSQDSSKERAILEQIELEHFGLPAFHLLLVFPDGLWSLWLFIFVPSSSVEIRWQLFGLLNTTCGGW